MAQPEFDLPLHGPEVPTRIRRTVQKDRISREVGDILSSFEISEVMTHVQDIWGEGEISPLTYSDAEMPLADHGWAPFDMHVGFSLATTVPVLTAEYTREYLGERSYMGICKPGQMGPSHSVYGDTWNLQEVRLRERETFFEITVQPQWDEDEMFRPGEEFVLKDPERYSIRIDDFLVPNGRKTAFARDISGGRYREDERTASVHYQNGWAPYKLEIPLGMTHLPRIAIQAESPSANKEFEDAVDQVVSSRKNSQGLPPQMRDYTAALVASLPKEFQAQGHGDASDFRRWSSQEPRPTFIQRLLHRPTR